MICHVKVSKLYLLKYRPSSGTDGVLLDEDKIIRSLYDAFYGEDYVDNWKDRTLPDRPQVYPSRIYKYEKEENHGNFGF